MTSSSYNQQNIKVYNRSLVLKLLCMKTQLTRIQLSALTGLTRSSITYIINEMINLGIVEEHGSIEEESDLRGRKPIALSLVPNRLLAIGVNISREYIQGILLDITGLMHKRLSVPLVQETEKSLSEKIFSVIDSLLQVVSSTAAQCVGIGISSVGPISLPKGIILNPNDFFGLTNIPIKDILVQRYRYPIVVDHDVNAAALAESLLGDAKDLQNFIYLGVGQGISCSMYINGTITKGNRGFSGEIGHCSVNIDGEKCSCGNRGCLELYASTRKIIKRIREDRHTGIQSILWDEPVIDWDSFIRAIKQQDLYAHSILFQTLRYLSNTLVTLINVFDPELIIIGDDLALVGDIVTENLRAMLQGKTFCRDHVEVPIILSKLQNLSPVIGSGCIVFEALFNSEIALPSAEESD